MLEYELENINLGSSGEPFIPRYFKEQTPLTPKGIETVKNGRETIKAILDGKDPRKMITHGFCSVHNAEAFKEYINRNISIAAKYKDKFFMVIRAYMEKPRTRKAWRGYIVDPNLKGEVNYHEGYMRARELLVYAAEHGFPVATEFVDTRTPNIIGSTISWACIGARTVEVNEHRGMASGISMPVGVKNNTSGNFLKAIDAIVTASKPDEFPALMDDGYTRPTRTLGNPWVFPVLRGGEEPEYDYEKSRVKKINYRPNYNSKTIKLFQHLLEEEGLRPNVFVDCSHENARSDNGAKENQLLVALDVGQQIRDGNKYIIGMMAEVHFKSGNKKLPEDLTNFNPKDLPYDMSVTDPCVSLDDWVRTLDELYRIIRL